MLSFIKKHIIQIVCLVVIILLLIFGVDFLSTPAGKTFLENLMGEFPFASFVYDCVIKTIGFSTEIPKIEPNSVSMDLVKLFVSSAIKCLIFLLFSRLFLRIRVPKNQILTGLKREYEYIEDEENTIFYKIKKYFFSLTATFISVFLTSLIIDKITSVVIDKFADKNIIVVNTILLVVFFIFYSILFSVLSGMKLHLSLVKTIIFDVVPNLLSTFGTTFFLMGVYITAIATGLSVTTLLSILLLFIWCAFADWLCSFLQRRFASKNKKSHIHPSSILATAAMYLVFVSYYFLTYVGNDYLDYFNDPLIKMLLNLPEIPLVGFIATNEPAESLFTTHLPFLLSQIPNMLFFTALVSLSQRLFKIKNFIAWYIAQSFITVFVIIGFSLLTFSYETLDPFWIIMVIVALVVITVLIVGGNITSFIGEILLGCVSIITMAILLTFIPSAFEVQIMVYGIGVLVTFGAWYAADYFIE